MSLLVLPVLDYDDFIYMLSSPSHALDAVYNMVKGFITNFKNSHTIVCDMLLFDGLTWVLMKWSIGMLIYLYFGTFVLIFQVYIYQKILVVAVFGPRI